MQVVRHVHHRVDALGPRSGQVFAVRRGGARVGVRGLRVAAESHEDVRGHVHQVAGAGHEIAEPLRARQGALRVRRGLDGVDVIVVGAGVIGVPIEHRLQRGHDLQRARRGLSRLRPEAPGAQIHQGFGEERGGVEIVGICGAERAHRIGVGLVARSPLAGPGLVAHRERVDVVPLGVTRALQSGHGTLDGARGGPLARGGERRVDVGAERQGHAPVGHGEIRIEARGLLEGAPRLVVVEGVDEAQALIEVALGERGGGGDRVRVISEVVEERHGLRAWTVVTMRNVRLRMSGERG